MLGVIGCNVKTHQRQVKIPLVGIGLGPLRHGGVVVQVVPGLSPFIGLEAPPCSIDWLGDFLALRLVVAIYLRAVSLLDIATAIAVDSNRRGSGRGDRGFASAAAGCDHIEDLAERVKGNQKDKNIELAPNFALPNPPEHVLLGKGYGIMIVFLKPSGRYRGETLSLGYSQKMRWLVRLANAPRYPWGPFGTLCAPARQPLPLTT